MNRKQIRWRLRYYLQYFPFTLNTMLCALAGYIAYRILYPPVSKEDVAPFRPFIIVMGRVAFWFVLAVVAVSVLSTVGSWAYYLWLRRKKGVRLQVSFDTETKGGRNKLYMNALLEGVRRPLLGFVKGRLFYDNHQLTDTFSLLSNKKKEHSLWRAAITGKSRMNLPDIREYELKGGFVFFEDMLHLFSLAVAQPIAGHFYQPPMLRTPQDQEVSPKKTETLDVRIEEMRRVEGDPLNYKDFEAGDDVRRIVWKVYAKNRELVVRVPEMFEPYASHLYIYASFYAAVRKQWLESAFLSEMLNHYKNHVWTVYDTLAKKDREMRFIPDQAFHTPERADVHQRNARIISNSNWQQEKTLSSYFNSRQGAVLCISSLTDKEDLERILEQAESSTVIYFVKLSKVFSHFVAWGWLKQLIFLPPKDRLNKLRRRWVFSPMRYQVVKREREIEQLLAKSQVRTAVI